MCVFSIYLLFLRHECKFARSVCENGVQIGVIDYREGIKSTKANLAKQKEEQKQNDVQEIDRDHQPVGIRGRTRRQPKTDSSISLYLSVYSSLTLSLSLSLSMSVMSLSLSLSLSPSLSISVSLSFYYINNSSLFLSLSFSLSRSLSLIRSGTST